MKRKTGEGDRKQRKAKIKEEWSALSKDDIDKTAGQRDERSDDIREFNGIQDAADAQIDQGENNANPIQKSPAIAGADRSRRVNHGLHRRYRGLRRADTGLNRQPQCNRRAERACTGSRAAWQGGNDAARHSRRQSGMSRL